MELPNNDDRFERAIRHPKLFSANAREGRSRRFVSIILFLMGALFVIAYGVWFASIRETAAETSAQAPRVRSHIDAPASASTVYFSADRTASPTATVTADARDGRIYKCLGKSGGVTFQQNPCPADSKTAKVISYVPGYEPVPTRQLSSENANSHVQQYAAPVAAPAAPFRNSNCKAAEIWADDRREQLGIHATFQDLRALQDYVYEHCKPQ